MATPSKNWKKAKGEEVPLPSGNVALIKRPGMEKLFAAGVLPDELTKIALENIEQAQSPGKPTDHLPKGGAAAEAIDPEMLKKFLESEGAIQDIFSSFDRITEMCVISPKVLWHMRKVVDSTGHWVVDDKGKVQYEEIPEDERLSDELPEDHPNYREEPPIYTDEIDIDDKTFIFNFVVGGTRDVESFREEYGDALADVQPREDVGVSS